MYEIIVIGTSWGGLSAVSSVIEGLPATFALPVVVVQHRSPDAPGLLAELLQMRTGLRVCEVEDKQSIVPGHVFVAPPNYHLLIVWRPGASSPRTVNVALRTAPN